MKRILVTARNTDTGYDGTVELVYGAPDINLERRLLLMDLRGAGFKRDEQIEWFVRKVPTLYGAGFAQCWPSSLMIAEVDMEIDFDNDFWNPFDFKVNRDRAVKLWDKLKPEDRALCVAGLNGYLRHLGRNPWKNKMNPSTWIKDRCWTTNWDNV